MFSAACKGVQYANVFVVQQTGLECEWTVAMAANDILYHVVFSHF